MNARISKLTLPLLAALMLIAPAAQAATLIDRGTETVDATTRLGWLGLTLTEGLSPTAALGAFSGYRWATEQEVYQFALNAGITAVDDVPRASDYSAAQTLISLLGQTFASTTQFGAQGLALRTDLPGFTVFRDPAIVVAGLTGRVYPGIVTVPAGAAYANVGVFMVRDMAPIPLPATAVLLGAGVLALSVIRRRKAPAAPV
jgi:hypothetical protein